MQAIFEEYWFFRQILTLFVALGPIVSFAEHLAVGGVRGPAIAPCRHMVGVHLVHAVDALGVVVVADGAEGAVFYSLSYL